MNDFNKDTTIYIYNLVQWSCEIIPDDAEVISAEDLKEYKG